jgi:hypothetical protein
VTWLRTITDVASPLLQAASITVTAIFAILGLQAWRRQIIGQRRIQVAEETLVATYKVKAAMSYIRSSMSFSGEGGSRPRDEHEAEGAARVRDTYFVPVERMQKTSGDFAEFEKMRLLCQVHFESDAAKPFDVILRARHQVAVAARMLVDTAGEQGVRGDFGQQLKGEIWEGYGSGGNPEGDPITRSVAEAVAQIEAICRPYLKP